MGSRRIFQQEFWRENVRRLVVVSPTLASQGISLWVALIVTARQMAPGAPNCCRSVNVSYSRGKAWPINKLIMFWFQLSPVPHQPILHLVGSCSTLSPTTLSFPTNATMATWSLVDSTTEPYYMLTIVNIFQEKVWGDVTETRNGLAFNLSVEVRCYLKWRGNECLKVQVITMLCWSVAMNAWLLIFVAIIIEAGRLIAIC